MITLPVWDYTFLYCQKLIGFIPVMDHSWSVELDQFNITLVLSTGVDSAGTWSYCTLEELGIDSSQALWGVLVTCWGLVWFQWRHWTVPIARLVFPGWHLLQWSYSTLQNLKTLNYLAQFPWQDVHFAIHSCTTFSTCANHEHGEAVEYIAKYLKGTANLGIKLHPMQNQSVPMYAAAILKQWVEWICPVQPNYC